jgi:hypothetical protein
VAVWSLAKLRVCLETLSKRISRPPLRGVRMVRREERGKTHVNSTVMVIVCVSVAVAESCMVSVVLAIFVSFAGATL